MRQGSRRRRIACVVDAEVAWLHEQVRLFVEAHAGSRSSDAVWEALLAEATTDLLAWLEGEPLHDDPTAVRSRKMGRVRKTFRMRGDLAGEYLRLERAWHRAGAPSGDFVRFVCLSFWRAWRDVFDMEPREYEPIYERERYRCASPTCERRDLTPHHLVFRSQGGGDAPDNVVGLCTWCHLQGIHTHGAIKAEPPSTAMTWKTPLLEVQGREVLWRRSEG